LGAKTRSKRKKLVQNHLAVRDGSAAEVIRRRHDGRKLEPDPLRGLFEITLAGRRAVVEYEPDPDLRDTEQIPLLEPGGVEAFLQREVLPHAPDAWYDQASVRVGYEISFPPPTFTSPSRCGRSRRSGRTF
jgi:type I restriction enzyme M protein